MFDILADSTVWAREWMGHARQPKPTSTAIRTNLGDGRTIGIFPFLIEFQPSRTFPPLDSTWWSDSYDAASRIFCRWPRSNCPNFRSRAICRSGMRAPNRVSTFWPERGISGRSVAGWYPLDTMGVSFGISQLSKTPVSQQISGKAVP